MKKLGMRVARCGVRVAWSWQRAVSKAYRVEDGNEAAEVSATGPGSATVPTRN